MNSTREYLHDRWIKTLLSTQLLERKPGEAVFENILTRYSEPHRFYHTPEHLLSCFRILDGFFPGFQGIHHVEMALWFHDVIYEPTAKDNEEKSAELAKEYLTKLGATTVLRYSVGELIMATKHTGEPTNPGAKILLDVDTSILAAPESLYQEYEDNIRREYSWVPMDIYRQKRVEILQMFLNRPFIYATHIFREVYEKQARENLARAIAALS